MIAKKRKRPTQGRPLMSLYIQQNSGNLPSAVLGSQLFSLFTDNKLEAFLIR